MKGMRSVTPMRVAKFGYIGISAFMCLVGICLIAVPDFSKNLFGIICGSLFVVFGIIRLIGFYSRDLYRLAFQYDLVFGAIMILLGVMILVKPESLMTAICIVLGISILADGICKIKISIDCKQFGIHKWWLVLGLAVITAILGLVLMFYPGESGDVLMILLGITLLAEGILNIGTVLTAVKIIKHQRPDIIDGEFEEISSEEMKRQ